MTVVDRRKLIAAALVALIVVSWIPLAHASMRGKPELQTRPTKLEARELPGIFDLDGDFTADRVRLESNGFYKTISIKFGNTRQSLLDFNASSIDQGIVVADDIDHDGDVDLIWFGSLEKKSAVVWINDGKGNFTEAKDNISYASELNALLSGGDPSDPHSLQTGHQTYSLTSSSFSDMDLAVNDRFASPINHSPSFAGFEGFANRSGFLTYLRKRGPPPTLS